jgi:hypothetical protein
MQPRVTLVVLAGLILGFAVACQQPSDSAGPARSEGPGGGSSPVAPAIEPEPTGPEQPIELPASGAPVAPAIEPEPTGPDPTIEFDGY